jgi:transposase
MFSYIPSHIHRTFVREAVKLKYQVRLSRTQRNQLLAIIRKGKESARVITRARVLLLADAQKTDDDIMQTLLVSRQMIYTLRRRFQNEALEVLHDKPRPGKPRKLDGKAEARLTAIACSTPPTGHARWSLRLLADELVRLEVVDSISHNAVAETLKKTTSNRGKRSSGASRK